MDDRPKLLVLDDLPHPTLESVSRFPDDDRLRRNGFRLMDRPKGGPAVWRRDGKEYTQREALRRCEKP